MSAFDFMFKKGDTPPPKSAAATTSIPMYVPQNMPIQSQGKVDYEKYFDELMDKSDLPGPDYREFSQAIAKMSTAPLNEQDKYKTIFSSFETMGATESKLVETANKYIDIFDKKKQDFEKQAGSDRQTHIVDKQTAIDKLNQEIQEKQATVQKMMIEKQQDENSLLIESNNFNNVYTRRKAVILADIEKIKTYLNGSK